MSERRALLEAIRAAPEDDAPRLVYADWLEEHAEGDADRDRAEFIRAQCELARLRYGSREIEARYSALAGRAVELLVRRQDGWVAELNLPPNRNTHCWFHRGMVASVWCTVRYFVEHGGALLDAAPVEAVCFRRATVRNVTELRRCPAFGRLPGVEFRLEETPGAVVARFFEALPVGHLRTVLLKTNVVNVLAPAWRTRNAALAVALARCPGLAGLKRLWLWHAGVGDEGGRALARSPHLAGLGLLNLEGNAFSTDVEAELRERFGRRLCLGQPDYPRFTVSELGWA